MVLNIQAGPFDMSRSIVPLLSFDDENNPIRFLGTSFFVGADPLLVTADHNVRDVEDALGIMLITDVDAYYPAELIHRDRDRDIAVLAVPGYRPQRRFVLLQDQMVLQNEAILCLEYGTTRQEGRNIFLSVATRRGNVTRQIAELELLGTRMENLLEVSFPVLRGASGAPILSSQGFIAIGMAIANASYHLMPAQVERVYDDEGQPIEEVQFMMPQDIAIHADTIQEVLDEAIAGQQD